ncbi:acyl-CoA carboxylase epsilon subunit [Nonomuraea sp. NPDC049480]|uniref:acyl-CoA carboxylase epsilon subunit n=1 Tax=Nonomuraea sp. NPDC049480 TaxID=3364353 RepID=UPI0037B35E57
MNVINGNPSAEELAALVVALLATPAPAPPPPPRRRRMLRRPLVTGPRGWRESRWNLGGPL